jgi:lysozyme family protein
MIMKNVLGALALVTLGSFAVAGSADASPAAALAGLSEQSAPAVEQVGWRHRRYWGYGYRHHGYGYGYYWKKHCYFHPYHWKCKHYGYGY